MTADTPPSHRHRLRRWLSLETTSGFLLLLAATIALLWANSPWRDQYTKLSDTVIGPAALHLDLSLSAWAADGLLAIFFFVVGVELKQEIVAGSLRDPRRAAVPVLAAVGGMLVPALIYTGVILSAGSTADLHGWAIPTATDIAFALAVLAIFGRGLPTGLRIFLLTLAVVDDLLAIVVIALFYTDEIAILPLAGALLAVALFGLLARAKTPPIPLLIAIAFVAWTLMHASGIHATIAGALLGLTIPAIPIHGESEARTHRVEHAIRPLSSGFALPVFAFFAAGVTLIDGAGADELLSEPITVAIVLALVLGKVFGVLGVTALTTRLTSLRLPDAVGLRDLLPIGLLTGIGFTVALLIAELSFDDPRRADAATIAILAGSLLSALAGAALLRWDAHRARSSDMNRDGIPDIDHSVLPDPAEWP